MAAQQLRLWGLKVQVINAEYSYRDILVLSGDRILRNIIMQVSNAMVDESLPQENR